MYQRCVKCKDFIGLTQLTTDKRCVFFSEPVHQFSGFQVDQFQGGSIVCFAFAMPHSQDKNAAGYGTADFLFSPHARTQTTRNLQGFSQRHQLLKDATSLFGSLRQANRSMTFRKTRSEASNVSEASPSS